MTSNNPIRRSTLQSIAWPLLLTASLTAHSASGFREEYEMVLRSQPDKTNGAGLFETCAACHGSDGGGTQDGRVPAIAAQHFRVIIKQLLDYRHDKRWDALMEHYSDAHNLGDAQDVADVAAYISDLEPAHTVGIGDGKSLSDGAKAYLRSCAYCHGASAEGDNVNGYPRLAGQHYGYLLRQMHNAVEGRRPNFSRAHVRLLARFERSDFEGLADFLSRAGSHKTP